MKLHFLLLLLTVIIIVQGKKRKRKPSFMETLMTNFFEGKDMSDVMGSVIKEMPKMFFEKSEHNIKFQPA